jgi:hypothetical protein
MQKPIYLHKNYSLNQSGDELKNRTNRLQVAKAFNQKRKENLKRIRSEEGIIQLAKQVNIYSKLRQQKFWYFKNKVSVK